MKYVVQSRMVFLVVLVVLLAWNGHYALYAGENNILVNAQEYYDDHFSGTKVFFEGLYGVTTRNDERTIKDEFIVGEGRFHLETLYYPDFIPILEDWATEIKYSGELLLDAYDSRFYYDTRELSMLVRPTSFLDAKVGRQILTWGTGDYMFINDMFPKDYISFFIGRDDEYLKKPSDALRLTFFSDLANLDVVYIPFFTPNTTVKGDRLSFYDSYKGRISGFESDRFLHEPPLQFKNGEIALRVYTTIERYEVAGYFFHGFYKNPRGYKNNVNELYYPPVDVYGASIRGPLAQGVANAEIGFYNSTDDQRGTDRMIENSSIKYLLGYSRDLKNDIDVGVQWYVEQMLNYDDHRNSLVAGDYKRDHFRQVLTASYRQDFFYQTLHFNLFTYYSPTDIDTYVRPSVTYDVNDHLKVTCGGNIFFGDKDYTEFGQLEENTNIYMRIRYSL